MRATVASSTSPASGGGLRRNALERALRHRVQSSPAVDQRPHPRRADLPAGQTELGEQRRHLGTAGDERLGADVDVLAADPLGAQDAAEPVGGVEHRDRRVGAGRHPQPVRGDESRNTAAHNTIRRTHNECTRATASVTMPGSVARQHPVAEVEDVAGRTRVDSAAAVLDDGAHRTLHHRPAGQQHHRIEVALQRNPGPDPGGGVGQRRAPVDADDAGRPPGQRLGHGAEQFGGADAEVRHRHPVAGQRVEHPGAVRQHVLAVVGQRQRARPGVEQLDRVDPGVQLGTQETDGDVGQRGHQRMPGAGLAEHHRLGAFVVAARAALHQVGRQRERRAGEPDQRHVAEGGHQQATPHRRRGRPARARAVSSPRRRRRCGSGGRSRVRRRARCPGRSPTRAAARRCRRTGWRRRRRACARAAA